MWYGAHNVWTVQHELSQTPESRSEVRGSSCSWSRGDSQELLPAEIVLTLDERAAGSCGVSDPLVFGAGRACELSCEGSSVIPINRDGRALSPAATIRQAVGAGFAVPR